MSFRFAPGARRAGIVLARMRPRRRATYASPWLPTGRRCGRCSPPQVIEREIANVAGADTQIVLPADKRFAGDWSLEGAAAALDRALADR